MDSILQAGFGERSLTKVAGVFPSEAVALRVARRLRLDARLADDQIRLLPPAMARSDRRDSLGREVEPEDEGIRRTLVRSHLIFGAMGAAAGLLAHRALYWTGSPSIASSPEASLAALVFFGTVGGLLVGGALALRPDHSRLMSDVRRSLSQGNWLLVCHPRSADQVAAVMRIVRLGATRVFRTI